MRLPPHRAKRSDSRSSRATWARSHDRCEAGFADKPFIIAGDNDAHLVAVLGVNPGKTRMQEAAKAVAGQKVLPIFAPGERERSPREFTDARRRGRTAGIRSSELGPAQFVGSPSPHT